jgi:dihydroxy-acid dehydratase
MEDFCYAGGVPAVLAEISHLLKPVKTVLGSGLDEYYKDAECWNRDVIFSFKDPIKKDAGLTVLRGSLAPKGAIIKPSAATSELLEHRGPAYVFDSVEDMKANINNEDLPVTKDTILVLKGCGPKGYPGMAEVGNMPIPAKLVKQGLRDMVRISDARMSGTAFGTVVLHVAPEAAAGGVLALVKTGDQIVLSAKEGKLDLLVEEEELSARRAYMSTPLPDYQRGYIKLYIDHVLGAERGADLDFLVGNDTRTPQRESH